MSTPDQPKDTKPKSSGSESDGAIIAEPGMGSESPLEHRDSTTISNLLTVLTRRSVLLTGAGTIAVAAAGTWMSLDLSSRTVNAEEALMGLLLDSLSYLDLEPEGLRAFVSKYLAWLSQQIREIEDPEKDVIERYLKSTDFFLNGGDESRTLMFIAFYDPYSLPCYSPFAVRP